MAVVEEKKRRVERVCLLWMGRAMESSSPGSFFIAQLCQRPSPDELIQQPLVLLFRAVHYMDRRRAAQLNCTASKVCNLGTQFRESCLEYVWCKTTKHVVVVVIVMT